MVLWHPPGKPISRRPTTSQFFDCRSAIPVMPKGVTCDGISSYATWLNTWLRCSPLRTLPFADGPLCVSPSNGTSIGTDARTNAFNAYRTAGVPACGLTASRKGDQLQTVDPFWPRGQYEQDTHRRVRNPPQNQPNDPKRQHEASFEKGETQVMRFPTTGCPPGPWAAAVRRGPVLRPAARRGPVLWPATRRSPGRRPAGHRSP